jgi:hypothetical protein
MPLRVAAIAAVIAVATAAASADAPRADQLAFRELYRELIETNTSHSVGSCTLAAAEIIVTTVEPSDPVVLPPPLTAAIMKPIEQCGVSGMFVDPDLGNIHDLNERIRVQSVYDGRDFLYALVKIYADRVR